MEVSVYRRNANNSVERIDILNDWDEAMALAQKETNRTGCPHEVMGHNGQWTGEEVVMPEERRDEK